MPNWCRTAITIDCKDEKESKKLYDLIDGWISSSEIKTDFGDRWLGNIVIKSGINTLEEIEQGTSVSCRGWVEYLTRNGPTVYVDTETAWRPMLGMWLDVIDRYAPDAELTYVAEEGGRELYATNDTEYAGMYFIAYADDRDTLYDLKESKALSCIKEELGSSAEGDIKKLSKEFTKSGFGWVYSWEYIPASEWD